MEKPTKDLVIIFCLAPLESSFCLFQLDSESPNITVCAFCPSLLYGSFKVGYSSIELLKV